MDQSMSRTVSSEGGSYDDSVGPFTPEFVPQLDAVQVEDDNNLHLGNFLKPDEDIGISLRKPFCPLVTSSTPSLAPVRRICFVGAGYVGGPTAAVIALKNPHIQVEVVDRNENRIKEWKSPHLPIHEPGLDDVVRIARDGAQRIHKSDTRHGSPLDESRSPNLSFSTDVTGSIREADLIFIAVSTPTKTFGVGRGRATDMSMFDSCVDEIVAHARPGTVIVEKSTLPCGTAKRIIAKFRVCRPGEHFEVLSNPEFLAEGTAIKNLLKPDRVIIGSFDTASGAAATAILAQVYSWVPSERIVTSNVWSSELSKLVANAMLAQRISSINSISAICEETGADIQQISKAIGRDARIGPRFLQSGLGFGGSCFRKDIASLCYLAESLGLDEVAHYWSQVNTLNNFQRNRFARKVIRQLDNNLVGKKITILGFAFKKDTGDCRESLAVDVIKMLLEECPAEIAIFDPYCKAENILREINETIADEQVTAKYVNVVADPYSACASSDAILIVTDCDQFKANTSDLPWLSQNSLDKLDAASPFKRYHDNRVEVQRRSTIAPDFEVTITDPISLITTVHGYNFRDSPTCDFEQCNKCPDTHRQGGRQLTLTEPVTNTTNRLQADWTATSARIDWHRILTCVKQPARIFDGRQVLDPANLARIQRQLEQDGHHVDVILESIGRKSSPE